MSETRRRKVIHLDMDAFYASVEQRDNPELRGQPVVVGGSPEHRGVVAAASYEAREFGIRSAMPMSQALRRCPRARRVDPDFARYRQASAELHAIFHEYTDLVEPVSLDEAYLDVTFNKLDAPLGHRLAKMLKSDIRRQLHLTASAGLAPNKLLAKIASDLDKPDGLVVVMPHQIEEFLRDLPVRSIPGVGAVTERRLSEMDVETIGQLASLPVDELRDALGRRGASLHRLSRGIDDDPVTAEREVKQLSQERTFAADVYEAREMAEVVRELSAQVAQRLHRRQLRGRAVTLKVRYPDFETVTRSHSEALCIEGAAQIERIATGLLARTDAATRGVRLIGVGVSGFDSGERGARQLDLFGAAASVEG